MHPLRGYRGNVTLSLSMSIKDVPPRPLSKAVWPEVDGTTVRDEYTLSTQSKTDQNCLIRLNESFIEQ